jgi:hypothetical protein
LAISYHIGMYRIGILLFFFFVTTRLCAQSDSIISYASGQPKYVLTFLGDSLEKNIYLSPLGDTIYKWDISKAEITEYPVTGDYLSHKEYDPLKKQLSKDNTGSIENIPQINISAASPPSSEEWGAMHSFFLKKCVNYTQVLREGSFTIVTAYKNHVQSGIFKKFYNGGLVVSGQYLDGKRNGFWTYTPYHYYPYYDITFFDRREKEWSFIYSVLPAALALMLLTITGRYFREKRYQYYFYAVMVFALASLLLRLCIPFERDNVWIRFVIPALWFVFWQAMIVLATVNLFFSGRRTNTHPVLNVFCLLAGLSFSIFVIFFKHLDF